MCARPTTPAHPASSYFNPGTKCCTYLPVLANYLVGQIDSDRDPSAAPGRATVMARLTSGEMVRPLGLGVPPRYSRLYEHASRDFGTSPDLLCPHFLPDGRCGIWRHRNGICATWFCKHVRGAVGFRFWTSLQRLLTALEGTLACWCLLEQGFGAAAFDQLSPALGGKPGKDASKLDGTLDSTDYRTLWGKWAGREIEFYTLCARNVEALGWSDVLRIGGPEIAAYAGLLREAYAALLDVNVPSALTVGKFKIIGIDRSGTQVEAYTGSDPLRLPAVLLEVLPCFDGRPTKDVVRSIADQRGIRIRPELIHKLSDFEILVPSDGDSHAYRAPQDIPTGVARERP